MLTEKRLDKITENLTPKQAVMVWLRQVNTYANVTDYIKSFVGQPQDVRPITLLTDRISSSTREAMKGKPEKTVIAAVHKAQRDVIFLIKLHHQVNFYFLTEERVWTGAIATLEAGLRAIRYRNALKQVVKRIPAETGEYTLWKMIAEAYLIQMYAFRQAVATISRNYFDGEELLFKECTQSLNAFFECIEALVEGFNLIMAKKPKEKMNLKDLQKRSEQAAGERISYLVDLAKSEVLAAIGEDQAAEDLAVRHIGRQALK